MLYNRVDLQIIVEPNYSGSKPYILCYHLVALLYSLLNPCVQCLAPGKAQPAVLTRGSTEPPQEGLGWRKPTDLDIGFCFGLKNTAALPKQAYCWLDVWEERISKAAVGINNSNLHIHFIFLMLLPEAAN